EQDIVLANSETPYAYLGSELSDIAQVVAAVSNLYDSEESKGVRELQEHLNLGYKVGRRDAVVTVLKGVLPALKKDDHAKELTQRVEHVVEKLQKDELNVRIVSQKNDLKNAEYEDDQTNTDLVENELLVQNMPVAILEVDSNGILQVKSEAELKNTNIDDNLGVQEGLVVCGQATFKSNVDILEDLIVQNNVEVGGDFTVDQNIFMNDSTSTVGNVYKGNVRFIHNGGNNTTKNTFVGKGAGNFTMAGDLNNVFGANSFAANTTGSNNSVFGAYAFTMNTSGSNNIGIGNTALEFNTTGSKNVAVGRASVATNIMGSDNTGVGDLSLAQAEGNRNIALGGMAGFSLITGDDNIYIGSNAGSSTESGQVRIGTSGDHTDCFVQGIYGNSVTDLPVFVNIDGKLGTMASSKRFKINIIDMDTASDGLMDLRPVQFNYKNDVKDSVHYGLIAEEVEQVYPELVVRDKADEPYSVRYHELPTMLLNELQKHKELINALQSKDVSNQKEIQELKIVVQRLVAQISVLENSINII
ncbi:MAG: tail fiber domain-containing protein, partial [Candidatus Babeliales bacterium]